MTGAMTRQAIVTVVALCSLVGWATCGSQALGGIIVNDPSLPPIGGTYQGDPLSQVADYGNFLAMEIRMTDFRNVIREIDGLDELVTFDVTLTAYVTQASPPGPMPLPVTFEGPLVARFFGKAGQVTGTFDAEILEASCSGAIGPFTGMIRENPDLPSIGQTVITDIGGGLYQIDSFFDICTELSVDGGGHWAPDLNAPHHMVLVPEPATLLLLCPAAGAVLRRRRRS